MGGSGDTPRMRTHVYQVARGILRLQEGRQVDVPPGLARRVTDLDTKDGRLLIALWAIAAEYATPVDEIIMQRE